MLLLKIFSILLISPDLVLTMATTSFTNTSSMAVPGFLRNVDCQPLPYYIEEKQPFVVSDPLVYKLHRCLGKTERNNRTICAPKETKNVTIMFFGSNQKIHYLEKENHTACQEVCRLNSSSCNQHQEWDERTCSCKCTISDTTKAPQCEKSFRWEQVHCGCRCSLVTKQQQRCNNRKIFSEDVCGCVCPPDALRNCTRDKPYLDPDTCFCSDIPVEIGEVVNSPCKQTGLISRTGLVVIILAEAILIIGIIIFVKYIKRHPEKACWRRAGNKSEDNFDRSSIETPTIEANPSFSVITHKSKKTNNDKIKSKKNKRSSKNGDKKPNIDIHKRPFLGTGGDGKFRKYRYEMNNLVPISTIKSDKVKLTDDGHHNVTNYQNGGYDVIPAQTIGSVTEI